MRGTSFGSRTLGGHVPVVSRRPQRRGGFRRGPDRRDGGVRGGGGERRDRGGRGLWRAGGGAR
jgi:hypothetical protein